MMTVARELHENAAAPVVPRIAPDIRIGLLGLGNVGSAVARLSLAPPDALDCRLRVTTAFVRDPAARARIPGVPVTLDPDDVFASDPDVIVEVLGGCEPARSLVLDALARRIPVVTANKSLLARHGDELLSAAHEAGVPLRYEASVIAGVPFLDTFARRPLASALTSLSGIVNGTTNYILTRLDGGATNYDAALLDAQRLGFAEPDPANDVHGVDAAEKLVILLRQFASCSVLPEAIETAGIEALTAADLLQARQLGGVLKPIVFARWSGASIEAFAGPAFVPTLHPLAAVGGATNGIHLRDRVGNRLCFTGPGAGPVATSITILDDVIEAVRDTPSTPRVRRGARITAPETGWFVRVTGSTRLPHGAAVADLLGGYGVWIERTSRCATTDGHALWLLTYPCGRQRIEAAVMALAASAACDTLLVRALDSELEGGA
jgi:homoserine dehydrogenase